ncbi:MAG TPA: cyanoexosortase A system-associated protein [Cyanobacteria bacterium UBA11049]|nr:cyanoexosortase A system-associated protein [Cyanobacteria bacterium UBA11049]
MNDWKNIRLSFLAITWFGVLLVLTKSTLFPASSNRTATAFVFPASVPLNNWQSLPSHSLNPQANKLTNYLSGRQYQYIQNDLSVNVEMRYVVNTVGDVQEYIKQNTNISLSKSKYTQRQQGGIGFYNLFTYQGKAYLSTCINPRGGTTVTDRQFKQNRNTYDVQFNRIVPWLLGQKELKDNRCLWTHISTPLKDTTPDHSYQLLETAFFSWYQWWYSRFPNS